MATSKGSKNSGKNTNSGKKGKGKGGDNRRNRMDKRGKWEEIRKAQQRRNNIVSVLAIMAFIVLIALIATMVDFSGPPQGPPSDFSTPYEVVGDEIHIPLSDITQTAKFFNYNSNGVNIKFFAVIGSDGDVHTAFDACEVCFQEKKGYYQDGRNMVCRNCGNRYTTNQIGTANQGGGCWPAYLDRTVSSDNVVIKISDLEGGLWLF